MKPITTINKSILAMAALGAMLLILTGCEDQLPVEYEVDIADQMIALDMKGCDYLSRPLITADTVFADTLIESITYDTFYVALNIRPAADSIAQVFDSLVADVVTTGTISDQFATPFDSAYARSKALQADTTMVLTHANQGLASYAVVSSAGGFGSGRYIYYSNAYIDIVLISRDGTITQIVNSEITPESVAGCAEVVSGDPVPLMRTRSVIEQTSSDYLAYITIPSIGDAGSGTIRIAIVEEK